MAKLFANSGDPDQTPPSADLIWVCTVCQLPFYGISQLQWVNSIKNLIKDEEVAVDTSCVDGNSMSESVIMP